MKTHTMALLAGIAIGATAVQVRIPIYSGRVFQLEAGHRSDLKPSTIPK